MIRTSTTAIGDINIYTLANVTFLLIFKILRSDIPDLPNGVLNMYNVYIIQSMYTLAGV